VLLSLLVCPGAGQWYLGRRLAGLVQAGLAIGVAAAFVVTAYVDILARIPEEPPLDVPGLLGMAMGISRQVMAENRLQFLLTASVSGAVYLYSAAEAFWSVRRERSAGRLADGAGIRRRFRR
jgi:F0F1-type ATP synthase membrane subunit c/vacuolar-type H+-ATPase subunit K